MLQCDIGAGTPFVKLSAVLSLMPSLMASGALRPGGEQILQRREVDSDDAPADADQLHDGRDSHGIGLFRVFQVDGEAGRRGEEGVSDEIDEGFVTLAVLD